MIKPHNNNGNFIVIIHYLIQYLTMNTEWSPLPLDFSIHSSISLIIIFSYQIQ